MVVTHEDARFALNADIALKRPKDLAAKRLRAAVRAIAEALSANRARARLYPRMRHPRHADGSVPRMLCWPNWSSAATLASWLGEVCADGVLRHVSGRRSSPPSRRWSP